IEQCRLAGPGRSHQRQKIPSWDVKVHALEHVDALVSAREVLMNISNLDQLCHWMITLDPSFKSGGGATTTRWPVRAPPCPSTRSPSVPPRVTARRSTTSSVMMKRNRFPLTVCTARFGTSMAG